MTKLIPLALMLVLALAVGRDPRPADAAIASPRDAGVFPYAAKVETLENGLKVVSLPLPNPDIIAFYTVVRSGSRNEIEPGKSGFAHFFEHMMFKGTKQMPKEAYDDLLTRLGAGTNGFTTDDYTCYYVVFAGRENLEKVVRAEADRFLNLSYTEQTIRTEAPVIEGEYFASASNPDRRLIETLRDAAFDRHSYKHTTLGFLADIRDMPNQYEYSLLYKKRFYAPDNAVLLVAGDFDHPRLMDLVRRYYGGWEKSNYDLRTPVEPPQGEARRKHIAWPSPTLARLALGWHGPAFSDEAADKAALDVLAELTFSPSSPLYQKLVIADKTCRSLAAGFADTRDPSLLVVTATVKDDAALPAVEAEILREIERVKAEPATARRLADVKASLRYGMARALETTDGIASTLAFYLNLTGDPGTLNRLYALYDRIDQQDVRDMARRYFRASNLTTVTLTSGEGK